MKIIQTFLVMFVLALIPACRTDITISEQRGFPKKPKFTIVPKHYDETSGLDFNAVYYLLLEPNIKGTGQIGTYHYWRFWPDGRVLHNYVVNRMPEKADVEDFTHAHIGYFKVNQSNIETELFIPDPAAWVAWDYDRRLGKIDKDSITFYSEEMSGEVLRHEFTFKKIPFDHLERKPDW